MAEPIAIPQSLYCNWYDYAERIFSADKFKEACLKDESYMNSQPLRSWAMREMLSNGDPIKNLAWFINNLVEDKKRERSSKSSEIKRKIDQRMRKLCIKNKNYFNKATHEGDSFTEGDIKVKVDAWRKLLVS
jgi:hypothetical protein